VSFAGVRVWREGEEEGMLGFLRVQS